jgi:signal transduction histidine kinase
VRSAYLDELSLIADDTTFREALRVLDAIERVRHSLETGVALPIAAGDQLADNQVAGEVDVEGPADVASQFARYLAQLSPLNPIVSLAHDMRSPLTSILFLVEALRSSNTRTMSEMQDRQLGLVYSAAFGLSSMVNDVLLLARGEIGEAEPVPFSVAELMHSVKHIVEPIAEEKRLEVILEPPESDARVGHPVMLSRVLLNLVTNALKFTERGTVTVTALPLEATSVEFSVRDTGPGIPPEVLPTVLDAFRKPSRHDGWGREHVFSSAGLGLSICKTLVEAMQSELRVESARAVGTRFSFVIDLPPSPDLAMRE